MSAPLFDSGLEHQDTVREARREVARNRRLLKREMEEAQMQHQAEDPPTWTALQALKNEVLLRAVEISMAGRHSLRVIGHRDNGEAAFTAFWCDHSPANWKWVEPCACGWCGDPSMPCECSPRLVQRFTRRRLREPYDLTVQAARPWASQLRGRGPCEPYANVVLRVDAARSLRPSIPLTLDGAGQHLLDAAYDRLGLTLAQRDRTLEVARTIAALSRSDKIRAAHLAEAIQYAYPSCPTWEP